MYFHASSWEETRDAKDAIGLISCATAQNCKRKGLNSPGPLIISSWLGIDSVVQLLYDSPSSNNILLPSCSSSQYGIVDCMIDDRWYTLVHVIREDDRPDIIVIKSPLRYSVFGVHATSIPWNGIYTMFTIFSCRFLYIVLRLGILLWMICAWTSFDRVWYSSFRKQPEKLS